MKKSAISVAALVVIVLALPALASAAPPPGGPGLPLQVTPDPIVAPKTTVGYNGQAIEVEIKNPGEYAEIDKVALEGEDAAEFFSNGSSCSGLPEGQKCNFQFGLKPSSVGLKRTSMVITFLGGRAQEAFAVSGAAVEPQLTFSPNGHDFGLQRVNREDSSFNFQLTNTGEAPVQPNSLDIQGDNGVFSVGNNNCFGAALEPGQSCGVEAKFSPHELRPYSAELRALVNGIPFTAALSGEGGRAMIETENPVEFGAAAVGSDTDVKTITLTNNGNLSTGFFIAIIAGGDSGSFRLLDESCTFVELEPGASCTAHVRFTPQGTGPKHARLAFFGDDDDGAMVLLQGEGLRAGTPGSSSGASVSSTPSSSARASLSSGFDFGSIRRGQSSPEHSFALRNDGNSPLAVGSAAIVGRNVDQFRRAGDECTGVTLDPGEKCLVRVVFAPRSAGVKTATMRLSTEGGVFTASLAGNGKPKSGAKARGYRHARPPGPRR